MSLIKYREIEFDCKNHENLLDAFFRNKIDIPFSCRNGTCQACLIQATSGDIPKESQQGLSQHLKDSRHLLPCRCFPTSDMQLNPPSINDIYTQSSIVNLIQLSHNIMLVSIKPKDGLILFKTGQFINIRTNLDNKIRSYSITNSYKTNTIDIHVQKIKHGTFSSWIFNTAKINDEILIHYPLGACYSSQNNSVSGKLFIATGSGLGAALAIVLEALDLGYHKPIQLFHGVKINTDLYLTKELIDLEKRYQNFSFTTCVSEQLAGDKNIKIGYVDKVAFEHHSDLKNWEVYIYGNPVMVKSAMLKAATKNCLPDNIFCDAFEYGQSSQYNKSATETDKMELIEEKKRKFIPDPKMWEALEKGVKLNQILNDFYDKVLSDPLLAPFFKGVTKEHIVGKQYAFLNQIYTGKDCYFGDRPRNAHQWMIISDRLFDHREKLFAESCIKCGLTEPFLSKILKFDESYRNVIVKTKVWPRITDGEIKAIKGFEEMVLDIGSLCDSCQRVLEPGTKIHYHDRTGEMFCQECKEN